MHKIGIVGGAGYIGSALSEYMCNTFRVRVIDKSLPPSNLKNKVEYQECDIRDYDELKRGLKDIDFVIHTAIVQIPLINEARKLGYEVNFLGTQNVCKTVDESPSIKGMILSGTWHVFGEQDLSGLIDEAFGFRPDKVEERARLYCLSKIAQECIVRIFNESSSKVYTIIRMGTVLGEGMPEKTAANIFIEKGLKGEPLTPYKHSMHRPMLYVDIKDVCKAYKRLLERIMEGSRQNHKRNSLDNVINLFWPKPLTILELSHIIKNLIVKYTNGQIEPPIKILDVGLTSPYDEQGKEKLEVNVSKAEQLLNMKLINPKRSLERMIKKKLSLEQ